MTSVRAWHTTLAIASLLAGCASAPEDSAGHPQELAAAAEAVGHALPARAATAESAASATTANARESVDAPAIRPNVVDVSRQPPDEAENTGQICRQMLKPNTNSIITACGTLAQWKRFRAEEARITMDNVLRMQRGEH